MADKVLDLGAPGCILKLLCLGLVITAIPFFPRSPDPNGRGAVWMAGRPVEKKGHWYGLLAFELTRKLTLEHVVLRTTIGGRTPRENEQVLRMRRFILLQGTGDRRQGRMVVVFFCMTGHLEAEIPSAMIFFQPSVLAEDGDREGVPPVTITELPPLPGCRSSPARDLRYPADCPRRDGPGSSPRKGTSMGWPPFWHGFCASPLSWEGMGRAGRVSCRRISLILGRSGG